MTRGRQGRRKRAGGRAGSQRDRARPGRVVGQAKRLELNGRRPGLCPGRHRKRRGCDRRELWRPGRERLPGAAECSAGEGGGAPAGQAGGRTGRIVSGVGVVDGSSDAVHQRFRLGVEVGRAQPERVARRPGEPDPVDRGSRRRADRSIGVDLTRDEVLHRPERHRRPTVGVAPRPRGVAKREVADSNAWAGAPTTAGVTAASADSWPRYCTIAAARSAGVEPPTA
jgi:hypothetical protein